MIIGNGQLAKAFQKSQLKDDICIFASGVSNSSCTDEKQFEREKNLLIDALKNNSDKKFVYFSSCALSAEDYPKNAYYRHKANMEDTIKEYSNNYYIFRIPQLFGDLINHKTLINFIYESIVNNQEFIVYNEAYRYIIEINDVKKLVKAYLEYSTSNVVVDIANPFRYKVTDIVNLFEKLFKKTAKYKLIEKKDGYILGFYAMKNFIKINNIDLYFYENYLNDKIKAKI